MEGELNEEEFMKRMSGRMSHLKRNSNKRRSSRSNSRKRISSDNIVLDNIKDKKILVDSGIITEEDVKEIDKTREFCEKLRKKPKIQKKFYEEINENVKKLNSDVSDSKKNMMNLQNIIDKQISIIEAAKRYFKIMKLNRQECLQLAKNLNDEKEMLCNLYITIRDIFKVDDKIIENGIEIDKDKNN